MAADSVRDLCRFSLLGVVGLVALACGGTDEPREEPSGDEPSAVLPLNPCRSELEQLGYEFATGEPMESDFEASRTSFYTNSDHTETFMEPEPPPPYSTTSPPVESTELPEPRCPDDAEPSTGALHIRATGFRDWGAVIGKSFEFNALDWDGLSFWARRGANGGTTMFASITEHYTDEKCGFCGSTDNADDDDPDAGTAVPVTESCDRFGVGIGLLEDWRFYAIPFSRMKQQGYGKPAPCLNQRLLRGLQFVLATGDWNLWIDDIRFYRAPEGERPPEANTCPEDPPLVCGTTPE